MSKKKHSKTDISNPDIASAPETVKTPDDVAAYEPLPVAEAEAEREPVFRKPRNLSRKKRIIIISAIAALVVAAAIVLILILGKSEYDPTSEFYFSSDLLSAEGGDFAACGDITFELYNYADSLRTSIYDISGFDIVIRADKKDITDSCKIKMSDDSIPKDKRGSVSVTVSIPEKYQGKPVDISVTSEPVTATLKGTFTVSPAVSYSLTSKEMSIEATLLLYSDKDGTFEVEWETDKLTGDDTDPDIESAPGDGNCTVFVKAGETRELRFFKKDIKEEYSGNSDKLPVKVTFRDGGDDK